MGELVTLATQVSIFFLFTPACLIARYGGRSIDLRRANAERRAIMRAYGIDDVEWQVAGDVTVDDFGNLCLPHLPAVPGLRRLEFIGPYPGLRDVTITGSANLHATSSERRPGWQFADDDMRAHVKAGGFIRVSFIDRVSSQDGGFDLADRAHRLHAVDLMRQEALIETGRAA